MGAYCGYWLGKLLANQNYLNRFSRIVLAQLSTAICIAMVVIWFFGIPHASNNWTGDHTQWHLYLIVGFVGGYFFNIPQFACDWPILSQVSYPETRANAFYLYFFLTTSLSSVSPLIVGCIAKEGNYDLGEVIFGVTIIALALQFLQYFPLYYLYYRDWKLERRESVDLITNTSPKSRASSLAESKSRSASLKGNRTRNSSLIGKSGNANSSNTNIVIPPPTQQESNLHSANHSGSNPNMNKEVVDNNNHHNNSPPLAIPSLSSKEIEVQQTATTKTRERRSSSASSVHSTPRLAIATTSDEVVQLGDGPSDELAASPLPHTVAIKLITPKSSLLPSLQRGYHHGTLFILFPSFHSIPSYSISFASLPIINQLTTVVIIMFFLFLPIPLDIL